MDWDRFVLYLIVADGIGFWTIELYELSMGKFIPVLFPFWQFFHFP